MNETHDLNRGLDSLERAMRALRRAEAAAADTGPWGGVARTLAAGHRRQSERLLGWIQPRLVPADVGAARAAPVEQAEAAAANSRVLALRRVSPELIVLRLSRPAGLDYVAGQHIKLRVGDVTRTYSLVSAPYQPHLELFIELHAGGAMSAALLALREGDPVQVLAAKGDFALSPAKSNHVMVATVTGIAPFISLLRQSLHDGALRGVYHLLHGASYQDEFGYGEELARLAAQYPARLHYVPAISRPGEPRNAGWRGATGRIVDLVAPYLRQHGLSAASTAIYACGHPGMVGSVRKLLRPQGYEIRVEPY